MRDPAEVARARRIGECDRAEPLAIELAVGRQDRGAEPRDQLGERRLARLDDLAREQIGVDQAAPRSASMRATVLLPDAIPPVSPITCAVTAVPYHARRGRVGCAA